jgi:hypothetical protein
VIERDVCQAVAVESYEGPAVIRQADEDIAIAWCAVDAVRPPTAGFFGGGRFSHPTRVHVEPGDALLILPTGERAVVSIKDVSSDHGTRGWFTGSGEPPVIPPE